MLYILIQHMLNELTQLPHIKSKEVKLWILKDATKGLNRFGMKSFAF